MKLAVYTCLVGDQDVLEDVADYSIPHICFSNQEIKAKGWSIFPLIKQFSCPIATARFHKILGFNFIDAEFVIWQDAKVCFKSSPASLVVYNDLAVFSHPIRDCIYDEGIRVIQLNKSDPTLVKRQLTEYRKQGYPSHNGLYETCVVARRKTFLIKQLNDLWWEELERFSLRDQISLPYVIHNLNLIPHKYKEQTYANRLFSVNHHSFVDYYKLIKLL